MKRNNIIILVSGDKYEAWGSLTEVCQFHPEFSYDYIKKLKFPFEYKEWKFLKVPFRTLA